MKNLFDENLGTASNSVELNELKKKYYEYDPSYVALSTMSTRDDFRKWLEELWSIYEPFSDKNFLQQLKVQFDQRSWELYLGATLINRGYHLENHNEAGPDFQIKSENNNVWIEAISIKKGETVDKVPEVQYGKVIDVPENEILLRLTAGIKEKLGKYQIYLEKGLIQEENPCVIAIDRSPLEHVDPQIPLVLKCLFGIGNQVLHIKINNNSQPETDSSDWSSKPTVFKTNGSGIGASIFNDPEYQMISAVIYSDKNIINSPRGNGEMGNNFTVIFNPLAKNSLPYNFINFGDKWIFGDGQVKKI